VGGEVLAPQHLGADPKPNHQLCAGLWITTTEGKADQNGGLVRVLPNLLITQGDGSL
jgi:hypothetical protein